MIACRSHFAKILYSLFGHNVQLEHDVQFRRNVQLEHNSQFGHDVQLDMRIHSQILDIFWSLILNICVQYLTIFSVCEKEQFKNKTLDSLTFLHKPCKFERNKNFNLYL